jgi:hypothetical protein
MTNDEILDLAEHVGLKRANQIAQEQEVLDKTIDRILENQNYSKKDCIK